MKFFTTRNKKHVGVNVKFFDHIDEMLTFWREFDTESTAAAMSEKLGKGMRDRIETLVSNAYEQGWKDAKSKKPKKKYFTNCVNYDGETPAY